MKVPDKLLDYIILVLAAGMILYHLAATRVFIFGPVLHFNTHLIFGFLLVYLGLARLERRWRWAWLVGALFSLIVFGYVYLFHDELVDRAFFNTDLDLVIGAVMVILALVATWKALGATLAIFAAMCIGYFYTCGNLPGFFHGPKYPLYRLIPSLAIGVQSGMYGVAMSVSANMIFLFMVFGGLLQASGVIKFFYEVGKLLGRSLTSGAAQATIVGGGMAGTITGSAATDAMIVGPFTVPFMKNAGYKAEEAGAIMAVSSTGAQIMPPVLGTAAFALSAVTGISYGRVCLASIIPAIFYFTALGLAVHLYTLRNLQIEKIKGTVDYRLLATVTPSFLSPWVRWWDFWPRGTRRSMLPAWRLSPFSSLPLLEKRPATRGRSSRMVSLPGRRAGPRSPSVRLP